MSGECNKCDEHALECQCSGINFRPPEKLKSFLEKNYSLSEMIEMAKNSEYGAICYSEKGPIQITKEGKLKPI